MKKMANGKECNVEIVFIDVVSKIYCIILMHILYALFNSTHKHLKPYMRIVLNGLLLIAAVNLLK